MPRLAISLDGVAALRRRGPEKEPDPVSATILAELAGADGILWSLAAGERATEDRDLALLRQVVTTHLNVTVPITAPSIQPILASQPDMVTFVPVNRQGDDSGDLRPITKKLAETIALLQRHEILVSLWVKPETVHIKACAKMRADYVELASWQYGGASNAAQEKAALEQLAHAANVAAKLGLGVSVGGRLNYHNVPAVTRLEEVEEINVGHAVLARALMVGLEQAVRDMVALVRR